MSRHLHLRDGADDAVAEREARGGSLECELTLAAEATSVSTATAGRKREMTIESLVVVASRRLNTRFFLLTAAPEFVFGVLAQQEG
jgi:hypothetical protein